jgi:arylsulfatase A-like enzyme
VFEIRADGTYGSKVNRTPHIDRIAQGGMRFDNCFCTNSICTPSRGVIMTGQYSHISGVKTLADPLDPARQNVAKLLQAAGYQTGIVGKWHLHQDLPASTTGTSSRGQAFTRPVMIEGWRKKKPRATYRPSSPTRRLGAEEPRPQQRPS